LGTQAQQQPPHADAKQPERFSRNPSHIVNGGVLSGTQHGLVLFPLENPPKSHTPRPITKNP